MIIKNRKSFAAILLSTLRLNSLCTRQQPILGCMYIQIGLGCHCFHVNILPFPMKMSVLDYCLSLSYIKGAMAHIQTWKDLVSLLACAVWSGHLLHFCSLPSGKHLRPVWKCRLFWAFHVGIYAKAFLCMIKLIFVSRSFLLLHFVSFSYRLILKVLSKILDDISNFFSIIVKRK